MGSVASKGNRAWLRACVLAVGLAAGSHAAAQDAKALTKAEVEALVVGKKLQYTRVTDGSNVVFDIRDNGKVYYAPTRTSRNLSIQGAYTIGDEGALCFKWEADKYVSLQDGCYLFKRDSTKTRIYARRNPETAIGDVIE